MDEIFKEFEQLEQQLSDLLSPKGMKDLYSKMISDAMTIVNDLDAVIKPARLEVEGIDLTIGMPLSLTLRLASKQ